MCPVNPSLTYLLWWQMGRWFQSSSVRSGKNPKPALPGDDVHPVAGVLFGLSGFWGVPLWPGDLDSFACLIYRTNVPMKLLFRVAGDEWAMLNSARTWSLEAHWGGNSKPQDLLPVVFANHKILANGFHFIFLVFEAFKWADGHFVGVLPPPWPAAQQPRRGCDGCRCSWSRNLIMLWTYVEIMMAWVSSVLPVGFKHAFYLHCTASVTIKTAFRCFT